MFTPIWLLASNFIKKGDDILEGRFVYGDDAYIDDYYMDEEWAFIEGFPNYRISNKGRVHSYVTQSFLKPKLLDNHGHLGVCLRRDGKSFYKYLARLIAEAFISNPNGAPIVRHLNDDPSDNSIENLEWGTQKDNYFDSVINGTVHIPTPEDREKSYRQTRTPIVATEIRTGKKLIFDGQGIAGRTLKIPQANIWKVLNDQRSHAKGYTFEYARGGSK